ncbi:MAG: class I SAM-dependent methyltransferase [Thalassobaculaceae bacterium]|nr:class I SAM-dependent methyltransferase [Thalassobaculaceae bacterium]
MTDETPAIEGALDFTNDWFKPERRREWMQLFERIPGRRLLEIGSYEGASACFLIEHLGGRHPIELHCVDTWEGGVEHQTVRTDMSEVEARFDANIGRATAAAGHPVRFFKHKGLSRLWLARLIASGLSNRFDFIYVDGSHQAPDVLTDAVMAFELLRVGGVMVFDDYLWAEQLPQGRDPLRCPKPAIDAFVNLNFRRCRPMMAPLYQFYVQKTAH